jgi:DNA-binding NtrC family response regulator
VSPPRILVVDNEPIFLAVADYMLGRAGFDVVRASSGQEALDLLKIPPPPDLILSDVVMPDIGGPALLASVMQVSPSTALMLMSVGSPPQMCATGGVPFLKKPFAQDDLLRTVERLLTEGRQVRERLHYQLEHSTQLQLESERLRGEVHEAYQVARATRQSIQQRRRSQLKELAHLTVHTRATAR